MSSPAPIHGYVPEFTLGDRLRRAREACGMTQAELARAVGISQRSVSNYEGDVFVPEYLRLREWATECQVDFAWLAYGDASTPPPTKGTWIGGRRRATKAVTIGYELSDWSAPVPDNSLVAA